MRRRRGYPPHVRFLGAVLVGIGVALLGNHEGWWAL